MDNLTFHIPQHILPTSKDVFEGSPNNGQSYLTNGENSPNNEQSYLISGENSPNNEQSYLINGKNSPNNEQSYLINGPNSPNNEQNSPNLKQSSPNLGEFDRIVHHQFKYPLIGSLKMAFPQNPNHPKQAYLTV